MQSIAQQIAAIKLPQRFLFHLFVCILYFFSKNPLRQALVSIKCNRKVFLDKIYTVLEKWLPCLYFSIFRFQNLFKYSSIDKQLLVGIFSFLIFCLTEKNIKLPLFIPLQRYVKDTASCNARSQNLDG